MRFVTFAMVALFALGSVGCGPKLVVPGVAGTTKPTKPGKRKTVAQLQEELAMAQEKEATAIEERKSKESELKAAKISRIQSRLHWVTGIAIGLAILCAVLAIFLPAFKKWAVYGAVAGVAVAGLAWLAAWLVPYLIWIGLAVLLIFIGAAIYYWQLDAKSRDQIVEVIDDARDDLSERMPEIWSKFREKIDTDSDRAIDSVLKRLGRLPRPSQPVERG